MGNIVMWPLDNSGETAASPGARPDIPNLADDPDYAAARDLHWRYAEMLDVLLACRNSITLAKDGEPDQISVEEYWRRRAGLEAVIDLFGQSVNDPRSCRLLAERKAAAELRHLVFIAKTLLHRINPPWSTRWEKLATVKMADAIATTRRLEAAQRDVVEEIRRCKSAELAQRLHAYDLTMQVEQYRAAQALAGITARLLALRGDMMRAGYTSEPEFIPWHGPLGSLSLGDEDDPWSEMGRFRIWLEDQGAL
jgi:hypothetical protein